MRAPNLRRSAIASIALRERTHVDEPLLVHQGARRGRRRAGAECQTAVTVDPRLLAMAPRKLRSAEVLVEQGCVEDGLSLAVDAMLATMVGRAGRRDTPSPSEAAVWLHAEAVPAGVVSVEEATALSRAIALSQSANVPGWLAHDVLNEARGLALSS